MPGRTKRQSSVKKSAASKKLLLASVALGCYNTLQMIKFAICTGVIIAAGYYYIMSASFNIAMDQTRHMQQQYAQAIEQVDQMNADANQINR